MDVGELRWEIFPKDNPDWGFARTLRVLLRRPQGEWSSSVFSVPVNIGTPFGISKYVAADRDFIYEGFFSIIGNENWKFLDALPVGIFGEGKWFEIKAKKVTTYPWKVIYSYEFYDQSSYKPLGDLEVEYYLMRSSSSEGSTLKVLFSLESKVEHQKKYSLVIDPFVSVRHMYDSAKPWDHKIQIKETTMGQKNLRILEVEKDSKVLTIATDFIDTYITKNPREVRWVYTLGEGTREQRPEGIFFKAREELLLAPATLTFSVLLDKRRTIQLISSCSDEPLSEEQLNQQIDRSSNDEMEEIGELQSILSHFRIATGDINLDKTIAVRILALCKFGIHIKDYLTGEVIRIPEAGAWWFRAPWLRDVYEGLLNNLHAILRMPKGEENIRKIILTTARYQDPVTGRIPNKLPEYEKEYKTLRKTGRLSDVFYYSTDATLLFIILVNRFIRATGDESIIPKIVHPLMKILECFEKGDREAVNGQPVIVPETSLLLSVPNHTWTDSQCTVSFRGIEVPNFPLRVPIDWIEQLNSNDPVKIWEEFHKPKFYLPEINAQWIVALKSLVEMLSILTHNKSSDINQENIKRVMDRCEMLLKRAKASFKNVFWNPEKGFLYNVVTYDLQRRDATEGSPAVVTVALIEEMFTEDEVAKIWTVIGNSLLVYRKPVTFDLGMIPFGIITKNSSERIFCGDRQYHEAVVWPRDTPYLIKLLLRLSMWDVIKQILLNNLDHQMSECALFFNNELFSLPEGNNPYPENLSAENPVPVKNPIQWWSHWVDPFMSFYGL